MRYSTCRDVDEVVRRALAAGWTLMPRGRGHPKLRSPRGHTVPFPCTPSDRRTSLNLAAQIKRIEREEAGSQLRLKGQTQ